MFPIYAIVIAVPLGLLLGGHLASLGTVKVRWAPLAVLALAVQLILFAGPVARAVGELGPPIYLASMGAVLLVVLANLRLPGVPLIAIGAASNLLAILANGGYMPADPAALASLGRSAGEGYTNSVVLADPAFRPLTDIFAMPSWLPLANVFSVGDVLIGVGLAWAIVAAMRRPEPATA
jgi:hypothetical protein